MAGVTSAVIIGGLIAAAATAEAVQSNQVRQAAKGEQNAQENQAQILADKAKKASADAANQQKNDYIMQQAKDRQQQVMAGAGGRGSTILTSPLGVTTPAPTADKTLLGM